MEREPYKGERGVSKNTGISICIDLDGVITDFHNCDQGCVYTSYPYNWKELHRDKCKVMNGAVAALRLMRQEGFKVIIYTARIEEEREVTVKWLAKHEIPYDELVMSKPQAFIYIDDFAHHFTGWADAMHALTQRYAHIKKIKCGDKVDPM